MFGNSFVLPVSKCQCGVVFPVLTCERRCHITCVDVSIAVLYYLCRRVSVGVVLLLPMSTCLCRWRVFGVDVAVWLACFWCCASWVVFLL